MSRRYEDLEFVFNYVKRERKQRPGRSIRDLRIEAVKVRAEEVSRYRPCSPNTVHRNLKFALGIDKKAGIEKIDALLADILKNAQERRVGDFSYDLKCGAMPCRPILKYVSICFPYGLGHIVYNSLLKTLLRRECDKKQLRQRARRLVFVRLPRQHGGRR